MSREDGLVPRSPEEIAHEAAKDEARGEASDPHSFVSHLNQEEVRVRISLQHEPMADKAPEEQPHFEAYEGGFQGYEPGTHSAPIRPTHRIIRLPLAIAAGGALLAATVLVLQVAQGNGVGQVQPAATPAPAPYEGVSSYVYELPGPGPRTELSRLISFNPLAVTLVSSASKVVIGDSVAVTATVRSKVTAGQVVGDLTEPGTPTILLIASGGPWSVQGRFATMAAPGVPSHVAPQKVDNVPSGTFVSAATFTVRQTFRCESLGNNLISYEAEGRVPAEQRDRFPFPGYLVSNPGATVVVECVASIATPSPSPGGSPSTPPARAATADKIVAIFNQGAFTTRYVLTVNNPDRQPLTLRWAGPNCGSWDNQAPHTSTEASFQEAMAWSHPHPPCAATTNHSEVQVTLSIGYQGGTLVCVYNGSESGNGPECKKL